MNHSASLELTSFEYEEEGAVSERLRREVARGFQDDLLCDAGGAQNVQETGKAFIVAAAELQIELRTLLSHSCSVNSQLTFKNEQHTNTMLTNIHILLRHMMSRDKMFAHISKDQVDAYQ